MPKPKLYFFETTDGPRLVKADSLRLARRHITSLYFNGDQRAATADDVVRANAQGGGLVIEDAGELGPLAPRGVGEGDVGIE